MGLKCKPLSVSEKVTVINKVDCVMNVPCTKISEELDIPLRKVTDKMLGWLDTGESVTTATGCTNSACICDKVSKNKKRKWNVLVPTLLSGFPT
jgi:hypothetical protein